MRIAIDSARAGIAAGQTPFGAAIIRGDQLVISAHNMVWQATDSTAHAEVTAIREACREVNGIDLAGCTIYSTCEPCPMCFSACHWAKLDRIVYGASIADAAKAGFNELPVSNEQLKSLGGSEIRVSAGVLRGECEALFAEWMRSPQRRGY